MHRASGGEITVPVEPQAGSGRIVGAMMRRTVRRIGATIIRIIMIRMMFISGAARPSTILK